METRIAALNYKLSESSINDMAKWIKSKRYKFTQKDLDLMYIWSESFKGNTDYLRITYEIEEVKKYQSKISVLKNLPF